MAKWVRIIEKFPKANKAVFILFNIGDGLHIKAVAAYEPMDNSWNSSDDRLYRHSDAVVTHWLDELEMPE